MGIQFVIGRAGSGKTRRCFHEIVEALRDDPLGPPIYWLLPKQATFTAERELACASGLGGVLRARVVSFEQLGDDVLAECGGAAIPEVTRLGRQMVLGLLLRKHEKELRFFSKVARHSGLAAKLDATLGEFDRAGRDPAQLESLVQEIEADDAASTDADPDLLRAKLHDLHLLYKAYTDYLGQERLDPARRLDRVLGCLSQSRQFRGAAVFVDGFAEFTESERRTLARLGMVASRVEIMLLMDPSGAAAIDAGRLPEEMGLFHRVEDAYRKLVAVCRDEGVSVEPPRVLRGPRRFETESLRRIEAALFGGTVSRGEASPEGIELLEAPDRRAEVDAAARRIREFAAQGIRFRDVAVLVRRLDLYQDAINASFHEHDVPYFVDRRRTMAHHPLLQFVRSALAAVRLHWSHEAMMPLLKSGLAGMNADEADRLENYVLEHGLRGSVWASEQPWRWRRRLSRPAHDILPVDRDDSAEIDALRVRLVSALRPFRNLFASASAAVPVKKIVREFFGVMDRLAVPRTLSAWIDEARARHRHEQAGEHEQVWSELVALFDQMVDLVGEENATLADFQEILEAGLETFDLALTPPTVDQVLVGQVDRTRTPEVKAVLLLGLNEGVFPYAPRDVSILSDAERFELQKHRFETDPGSERRLLDENLLGYVAFTRSSRHLYVSRCTADDAGRALGPSPFWRGLREMFPSLEPACLPRDERTDAGLIGTPRQLLTTLMRWVRTGAASAGDDARPALYDWLARHPAGQDPLANLRYRAWKALAYENNAWLTKETAAALFPSPLRANVSQVEVFATCPFRHFLRYGLRLREREEDETPKLDLERAFHDVLEQLVREMLARRSDWCTFSPEQCGELVRSYAARAAETLRGELMLSNARNQYLLSRIEKTLEQVVAQQTAAAKRGQFRTAFANVGFGTEDGLPPLAIRTPGGKELHLAGRIDRVDVLEDQAAFAVFDYRLYGGELSLGRVSHGISLQLLSYLLVLQAHGEKLAGKELAPAAAFYVRLLRQLEKVDHPSEAPEPDDPKFPLRGKQRGIFDADFFRSFDNDAEGGSSDVVSARLKKDGGFGYKSTTDVADKEELLSLLDEVRRVLGRIGDQIVTGEVGITPYRIGTLTPCPSCGYRSVCRFDASLNRYTHLTIAGREDVLRGCVEGGGE